MSLTMIQQASRIVLVDDQRGFAEAVTLALELTDDLRVVGTAATAETGIETILRTVPDLIVLDYRLDEPDSGADIAARLRADDLPPAVRRTPIVILTGHPAPLVLRQAAQIAGVTVVSKNGPIAGIVGAFRQLLAGEAVESAVTVDPFGLSPAEVEVLEHLAEGATAQTIASSLSLSLHAIRARIKGTLKKMNVSSQLEAVVTAVSIGLVVPPSPKHH